MSEIVERELGWNDEIEKEGGEFILLPAGDYDFTVESFERGRHAGSDKLPACNKAILKLRFKSPDGKDVTITHNLFLHTITESMLSAFFSSIGQKKKGEKVTMNWNAVPGSSGKAKVEIRIFKKKDGTEGQSNEIRRFYPKEDAAPKFTAGSF